MPKAVANARALPLPLTPSLLLAASSSAFKVIFTRSLLDCPYRPLSVLPSLFVTPGRTSITVVDPCLDPAKGLVWVLLCVPGVGRIKVGTQ